MEQIFLAQHTLLFNSHKLREIQDERAVEKQEVW